MRLYLVCVLLGLCTLLAACSGAPVATPSVEQAVGLVESTPAAQSEAVYRAMSVDQFASILESTDKPYTIVNVHIPYEGEVPNTDLQVTYNDVDALLSALPDKNAPIILYCRSGRMSDFATRALVEQGYTQVWDVTGGMNAWTDSGRELLFND